MRTHVSLSALAFASLLGACAEDHQDLLVDEEAAAQVDKGGYVGPDPVGDEESGDLDFFALASRSDFVVQIVPFSGNWGTWRGTAFCPEGTYAASFSERTEGNQGDGDDTGLNSVSLDCYDRLNRYVESVSPHHGYWGGWGPTRWCPSSGFMTGGDMKYEKPQGSGDDTAANAVSFTCSNGGWAGWPDGSNPGPWGDWQPLQSCPAGTAVCGLNLRIEKKQGDGDDTAMNGIALQCCNF